MYYFYRTTHTFSINFFNTVLIANSLLSTVVNFHVTFVLVWQGHESWENSHIETLACQLLCYSFFCLTIEDIRVEKTLIHALADRPSFNSCFRLTRTWVLRKLSCKLSHLNSHKTIVLVWPGRKSWELLFKLLLANFQQLLRNSIVFNQPEHHENWAKCYRGVKIETLGACFARVLFLNWHCAFGNIVF